MTCIRKVFSFAMSQSVIPTIHWENYLLPFVPKPDCHLRCTKFVSSCVMHSKNIWKTKLLACIYHKNKIEIFGSFLSLYKLYLFYSPVQDLLLLILALFDHLASLSFQMVKAFEFGMSEKWNNKLLITIQHKG